MKRAIYFILLSLAAPLWANTAYLESKLEHIVIPEVEFDATPLSQAIEFLRTKSVELDDIEPDPQRKGVNIILLKSANEIQLDALVSMKARNMSLGDLLGYVAQIAGLQMGVHENAVVIGSQNDLAEFSENEEALAKIKEVEKILEEIRIPHIEFDETPVAQAIEFVRAKSVELDDRKGVNIIALQLAQETIYNKESSVTISLKTENVSLGGVLHYVAAAAGLEMDVHPEAIVIGSSHELDRMRQILQLPRRNVSSQQFQQPPRIRSVIPPKR